MAPPLSKQFDNVIGNIQISLGGSKDLSGFEAKVTRTQEGKSRIQTPDRRNRIQVQDDRNREPMRD